MTVVHGIPEVPWSLLVEAISHGVLVGVTNVLRCKDIDLDLYLELLKEVIHLGL